MIDVQIFESAPEVIEFDSARWWTCSCGASTARNGRVPNNAPEVCEHVYTFARRLPLRVLVQMIVAAKSAQTCTTT